MTNDEATELLTDLEAAFPYPPLTPDRLRVYGKRLAVMASGAGRIAVDRLIDDAERQRFPSVGELMAIVRSVEAEQRAPASAGDRAVFMFRTFDADADSYRELDQPIPWTPALQAESNAAIEEAWRRENTAVTA